MVVVGQVGSAGSMAGVVMVGKQGGEGEQDRKKKGGGGRLWQIKARQNLDKSLLAQKELLTSYQEAAFVPFQLSLFA